jgi:nucleoid-associated protein YgaU
MFMMGAQVAFSSAEDSRIWSLVMTAGSRIVIALIVLAFLGTGLYYLAISDEEGVSPAIAPAVSEPTSQPTAAPAEARSTSPVAEQTLAFRVPVSPSDSVDLPKALAALKVSGGRNVIGAPMGWYPIQRLGAFYSSDDQKQALAQDPSTYLRDRFGLVAGANDDKLYVLLYGTSGKSLAPARRRGVDVMSATISKDQSNGSGLELALGENTFEMLKTLQARNVSRSWAILVDGVIVDLTRIESLDTAPVMIGSGLTTAQLESIKSGILGTSKMMAASFLPAVAGPEREMLLATSPTVAPVKQPVADDVVPVSSSSSAPLAGSPVMTKYVVKEGDTLAGISEEWFGRLGQWSLIVAVNPGMQAERLSIGQVLLLPPKDSSVRSKKPVSAAAAQGTFVIRPGDNLSKISLELYGSEQYWDVIYKANEAMIGKDPAVLVVGKTLVIPPKPNRY